MGEGTDVYLRVGRGISSSLFSGLTSLPSDCNAI